MSDARALLRAKRQEARISHPLASYNSSGHLRCFICGTLVKFASAWEGHLGSKAHRTNVARIKEEERLRDEARAKEEAEEHQRAVEEQSGHKRKATAVDNDNTKDDDDSDSTSTSKKPKIDAGFPADFFSDPTRAPVLNEPDSDDDENAAQQKQQPAQLPSAIDLEYERFQKELLLQAQTSELDARETYDRATVVAEPVITSEVPEGFPEPQEGAGGAKAQEGEGTEIEVEPTEEEKRQQKEVEEKELIMDRLLDEERAQEEADMKVQMMKNRLEAFKKQRDAKRAAKAAAKSS
jgi:zinc finger protein 830